MPATEQARLPVISPRPQQPTCRSMRVRNVHDAHAIFHAVAMSRLPMLQRALDNEERQRISPGDVYVWEERTSNTTDSTSLGAMQRFVDGRLWGPSKAREYVINYRIMPIDS